MAGLILVKVKNLIRCCCIFILLSPKSVRCELVDDSHTFHCSNYFEFGGIRTCLGISSDPMFLWISSNSCPLNLLFVWSHQSEKIIVKRLIQGRNNVTWVLVEPRSCDQGKNNPFLPSRPRSQPIDAVVDSASACQYLFSKNCPFFFLKKKELCLNLWSELC